MTDQALAHRFADGQRHLTPVVRQLMRATGDEVDRAIDRALAEIGAFCGADRSYVFRFDEDGTCVNNTHEWCQVGIEPQIDILQGLPKDLVEPWMPSLLNDRVHVVDDVANIPKGDPVREVLESQDIRGLIAVPITDAGELTGFVGFDIVRARPPFDLVEIGLLRNVTDAIGAALARRSAAEAAESASLRARIAEEEVHRLAHVAEVSTNLIIILDTEQRIVWANKAFEEQSGHRLDDVRGRDFSDLVRGPASDPATEIAVKEATAKRKSYEGETVNYNADGTPYWIQFNIHPMCDRAGTYVGYVSIETVISERKALEQDIEARNAFLSAIMRTSVSAIVAIDDAGRVAYANTAAQSVLGLTPDPAGAGGYLWPDWVPESLSGESVLGDSLFSAIRSLDPAQPGSKRLAFRLPDGERRVVSVNATPLSPALNGADIVLSISDITELEEAAERLRQLADEDPLTGLVNRRGFATALDRALPTRGPDAPSFAVLMIDLDNFKVVNDTLRHDAGDSVLQEVSRRLLETARAGDCVARLGGDEFVVLAYGLDAAAAYAYAEQLRHVLAQPVVFEHKSISLTASVGVAAFPEHGHDRARLVMGADVALFGAKRAGRDRTEILSQALCEAEARRTAILGALADSDLDQSLHLVFQPQFRMEPNGAIVGAEVLLRWNDPVIGDVSASEFVPIAEDAGVIGRIDQHVIDLAIRQLARWDRHDWQCPLSVNVSSQTFSNPGFAVSVLDRLAAAGVDPARLVVELTETAPISLTSVTEDNISLLRDAGIGIAIDDFGTGYASLQYLQKIAATELKIDRDFVVGLGTKSHECNAALVRAIIAVARALDLSITAEGVETKAQFEFLEREGCNHVQGFLTGVPMSETVFERTFITHDARS